MASIVSKTAMTPHEEDEMSDEQMEELLAQATQRLREKEASQQLVKTDSKDTFTFPKLNAGQLEKPYTTTKNGVARVDSPRLLQEQDRKQANGTRKVEDPVAAKKLALEVCFALRISPFCL